MGSETDDPLLSLMKEKHIPLTRENYLTLAYMGEPPEWCPELESEIPEQFQDWDSQTFGPPKEDHKSAEIPGGNLGRKGFYSLTVEELEELGNIT